MQLDGEQQQLMIMALRSAPMAPSATASPYMGTASVATADAPAMDAPPGLMAMPFSGPADVMAPPAISREILELRQAGEKGCEVFTGAWTLLYYYMAA